LPVFPHVSLAKSPVFPRTRGPLRHHSVVSDRGIRAELTTNFEGRRHEMKRENRSRWGALAGVLLLLTAPIVPNAEAEDLAYDVPMSIAQAEGDEDFIAVPPAA